MTVRTPPPALPAGLSWSSGKGTIHLRMHEHIVARAEPRGTAWLVTANMHAASDPGELVTCIAPNRLRAQRWLAQWARTRLCRKTDSGDIEVIPCSLGSSAAA